jgi:hypothetical protein
MLPRCVVYLELTGLSDGAFETCVHRMIMSTGAVGVRLSGNAAASVRTVRECVLRRVAQWRRVTARDRRQRSVLIASCLVVCDFVVAEIAHHVDRCNRGRSAACWCCRFAYRSNSINVIRLLLYAL